MALGIGIVGTGKIAKMHARALGMTGAAELVAISSRNIARAEAFAAELGGLPVEGIDTLLGTEGVDAIYIATPTSAKEEIAMAAIAAGKHIWIEKPLLSESSAARIVDAARNAGLAVMDATHFTHNIRTKTIRASLKEDIGTPLTISSTFFANVGTAENIRFDPALEPQGCLGDLGWYCARAAIEFLGERGAPKHVAAVGTWEDQALVGVTGLVAWNDTKRMTFDCGFRAGAFSQDLTITGSEGMILMDDFVHDHERGRIDRVRPDFPSGYRLRKGRSDPGTTQFKATPTPQSHVISLIEHFAELCAAPGSEDSAAARQRMTATQQILDAIFCAVR